MIKKILVIFISIYYTLNLTAQTHSITPSVATEFCPKAEIIFTVSLPGATSNIFVFPIALNDVPSVTQGAYNIVQPSGNVTNTVFNFKGKFDDKNNKQTFQCNYKDGGGLDKSTTFTFPKIKSLYYPFIPNPPATNPTIIIPNQATITAPRCQIINSIISFANVVYGNPSETPTITYGTVMDYEYLLPTGWKLNNGTPSNGTSWQAGFNSATVTSDLANGIGGSIRIRPSNIACGTGLISGQEAVVLISRPAPTLNITPSQNQICTGQTVSYTINGMPAGSTVKWTLPTNTTLAQITSSDILPTVSVKALTGAGTVTLTATVTHCSFPYPVLQDIQIGVGTYPQVRLNYDNICGKLLQAIPFFYSNNPGTGTTGFRWSLTGDVTLNRDTYFTDQDGGDLVINPLIPNPVNGRTYNVYITVKGITGCGITNVNPYTYIARVGPYSSTNVCAGGPLLRPVNTPTILDETNSRFALFPNPAKDKLIVTVNNQDVGKTFQVVDNNGKVLYQSTIIKIRTAVDVSHFAKGMLMIKIFDKNKISTMKFIKL